IQANLDALMRFRVPADPWLEADAITDEQRSALRRYARAVPFILAAQRLELKLDMEGATDAYVQAAQLCPDDRSIRQSLEFPRIVKLADDGNPTAWLLLGRSQQLQKHYVEALDLFDRYFKALQRMTERDGKSDDTDELSITIRRQAVAWRATAER